MNEILTQVTVKEMGHRFAQIRNKMGLSQTQVAQQLGGKVVQSKVSDIEKGTNVLSPLFLAMELFYLQHVSAEALFAPSFNPDDPNLFNKNYSLTKVAKARIELFKAQMKEELDEKIELWSQRLDETADYL